MPETAADRIHVFKADLLIMPDHKVIRRHIIHGSCFALDDATYFGLRDVVSEELHVHPNEIVMVGSAKLGFSIAPGKRFREFGDTSDLDLAVVSPEVFDKYWLEAYRHRDAYWPAAHAFKRFLFQGWIRPDKFPPAMEAAKNWWNFFRTLTQSRRFGRFKISAGVYRSWSFLEQYQGICVSACRDEVEAP